MKRSVAVEIDETDSSTETESLLEHTPRRMSDLENETSPSESVSSEDVARQIKAVKDPLTQQLALLWELLKELRDEQALRRHEETASSRAASTSTGRKSRSDNQWRHVKWKHVVIPKDCRHYTNELPRLSAKEEEKH